MRGDIYTDPVEALEANMVEQLQNLGPDIEVTNQPETEAEYERYYEKKAVIVNYAQSVYATPQSTSAISQQETLEIEVILICKVLRGPDGIFTLKHLVQKKLLGFRPGDGTAKGLFDRLYLTKFVGWKRDKGVFIYKQTFACNKLVSQRSDVDILPVNSNVNIHVVTNTDSGGSDVANTNDPAYQPPNPP